MKKISHLSTVSSLIVLAFIVPQIAFAAWWNPISWFGGWNFFHRADTQTQVLENRVKELEKQLANTATSTHPKVIEAAAPTPKKIAPIAPSKTIAPTPSNPIVTSPQSSGTALSTYSQCLNDATALINQRQAENKVKEQQCLSDNAGNWQASILCSYSVDTSLTYSACTGSYNPYHATTNSQPNVPTQSGFDAIESTIEKQKQETFQRDTCQQLGGSYISGTCAY